MTIVWKKSWINTFESPWSIFEKISLKNYVKRNEILRSMGNSEVKKIRHNLIGDNRRELFTLSGFDTEILMTDLEYDLIVHNDAVINAILKPVQYFKERRETWFSKHLRWCPNCIERGYHSWLHQFVMVIRCPVHEVEILEACPDCQTRIPFLISDIALNEPFTCKCGFQYSNHAESSVYWDKPVKLLDEVVMNWLSYDLEKSIRWLFLPRHTSLDMFTRVPLITSKPFIGHREKTRGDYYNTSAFRNELYQENVSAFRSIDRFIRKKLKKHQTCILSLQELRKNEGDDFPNICPYAYAYVFWKHTLLQTEKFYKDQRSNDMKTSRHNGINVATILFEDEIKEYFKKIFDHTNLKEIENKPLIHWVLNKATGHLCLNYFQEWLSRADQGSKDVSVPKWNEVMKMKARSIPEMVFTHGSDMEKQQSVDFYYEIKSKRLLKDIDTMRYECPFDSQNKRSSILSMKSYTPLSVAMMVFDNPCEENKRLSQYVSQYVTRLTL